jgi:hypothetical protein
MMVIFANIKKRCHGLSQLIQMNQSGLKAENEQNSESKCRHTYGNEFYFSTKMSNSRYDVKKNAIAKQHA